MCRQLAGLGRTAHGVCRIGWRGIERVYRNILPCLRRQGSGSPEQGGRGQPINSLIRALLFKRFYRRSQRRALCFRVHTEDNLSSINRRKHPLTGGASIVFLFVNQSCLRYRHKPAQKPSLLLLSVGYGAPRPIPSPTRGGFSQQDDQHTRRARGDQANPLGNRKTGTELTAFIAANSLL